MNEQDFDELIVLLTRAARGDLQGLEEVRRTLGSAEFQINVRREHAAINDPDRKVELLTPLGNFEKRFLSRSEDRKFLETATLALGGGLSTALVAGGMIGMAAATGGVGLLVVPTFAGVAGFPATLLASSYQSGRKVAFNEISSHLRELREALKGQG